MEERIKKYNELLAGKSAEDVLAYCMAEFTGKITFSTSLGAEDQVITDMIFKINECNEDNVKIITLDTGRLFNETYETLQYTNARYGISLKIYFPDQQSVEKMVKDNGINLFYESVDNHKLCCGIRKVDSLKRALLGMDAWITGVRKEQTHNRTEMQLVEWDEKFELVKINPLIGWTEQQVWQYIRKNNVPYNALHDKGYPSIGCAPCTRAIAPGESDRDGRWWWEKEGNKECGIHLK